IGMEIRNAAGTWSNNTGDPMYDAYVYVNDGSDKNIIITLTNLPAGRFDFYLYGHADPGGQGEGNSQFQITSGGKTTDWIGTARSAGWRADQPWTEGKQYVRFRGIEVNRDEPVMVTVRAGFDGAFTDPRNRPPVINGLQIVKTDGGGDSRNGLAITPYVAEPFSPAAELEKTQQSILQEREKSARNLQLLDALRESQNALRTQVLTDLQRRMVQVQERLTQADAQYEEASRLYTQAQGFKDRPELLPKPAASDPRYQKLKEALDQAQVAYLERPNDGDQTVKTKLESLHRFLHNTYLEELNVALKEADKTVKEYEFKLEELKNRLAAEQNRLKQEL
ncbi:MAG TPA: hypothetical protein P5055_19055, partial [Candidatus Paceibacterota bacterium]|nr:hypothetical protein [Candidatus Paceibacterota bacterium]